MLKKISLSLVTIATLSFSSGLELYEDPITKQIFSEPANGRVKLGSFISELNVADKIKKELKGINKTKLSAKAKKLKFHGRHYLGYTFRDKANSQSSGQFETRRNYLQVKAYFNDKSFARMTLDTHNINDGKDITGGDLDGTWNIRLKYAYVFLADILPNTGVEIGQAHRPWIDYEEHNGWWYRHIDKVFSEDSAGAHLINSADIGINFKTKTDYFTSEIGLFNGEGYHTSDGLAEDFDSSFEWRLTANLLGNGKKKMDRMKDEYFNASFFGVASQSHNKSAKDGSKDFNMYGIHAVYNNPSLLVAGQYIKADDDDTKYDGKGYSLNATYRPTKEFSLLARYDSWDSTDNKYGKYLHDGDMDTLIYGVGYKYNKYVQFVANIKDVENKEDSSTTKEWTDYMLTTYVKW